MRRFCKKLMIILVAAVMSLSALALTACGAEFTPPAGDTSGEVSSNGGFVVEKGNYFYFINGVETYTSDNTYGNVVKGALMRIAKDDLAAGEYGGAQMIVPSLMVAADYTSGLFIYGDRVYFASPTNVKNTSGEVENSYLDFMSAKLDGSDVSKVYFRVDDNSTVYRFVEEDGVVYVLYVENSNLHSYNTQTGTDTVLAEGMSAYVLNSTDKTDPVVYYTMPVVEGIDTDNPYQQSYNQIYRVSAATTQAPYEYAFDESYLEEHDGEEPYVNLGTIVLDGIGKNSIKTQFTHSETDPFTPNGYTYTLVSYTNGGIYYTRTEVTSTDTQGEGGWLYYLAADKAAASGWDSVSGNAAENSDVIAQNTTHASASAIFYIDGEGDHHYLYVSGSSIYRADVGANGVATTLRIAKNVSSSTLMFIDDMSDATYDYVYFNRTNGSGLSVERAVYNGTEDNYKEYGDGVEEYRPVKVYDIQHASSWYPYEVIGGYLFFADAEALSSTSYNYVSVASLRDADGNLLSNSEIEALNDKYEEVTEYITTLADKQEPLSLAIKSYFYTGKESYFRDNIQAAIDAGKKNTYLYSEEEQKTFDEFVSADSENYKDENGNSYAVRSYFFSMIGKMSEADEESYDTYWTNALAHYTAEETEEGLPAWAWWLIGVGIAVVVAAAVLIPVFVVRAKKRKAAQAPVRPKMAVDTTDDKSVDVYATDDGPNADAAEEELPDAIEAELPEGEETPSEEDQAVDEKTDSTASE